MRGADIVGGTSYDPLKVVLRIDVAKLRTVESRSAVVLALKDGCPFLSGHDGAVYGDGVHSWFLLVLARRERAAFFILSFGTSTSL